MLYNDDHSECDYNLIMLHSCINEVLFHRENVEQILTEVIYPTVQDPRVTDEIVGSLNTSQIKFLLKHLFSTEILARLMVAATWKSCC